VTEGVTNCSVGSSGTLKRVRRVLPPVGQALAGMMLVVLSAFLGIYGFFLLSTVLLQPPSVRGIEIGSVKIGGSQVYVLAALLLFAAASSLVFGFSLYFRGEARIGNPLKTLLASVGSCFRIGLGVILFLCTASLAAFFLYETFRVQPWLSRIVLVLMVVFFAVQACAVWSILIFRRSRLRARPRRWFPPGGDGPPGSAGVVVVLPPDGHPPPLSAAARIEDDQRVA
jgi:hypothetical protein